MMRTTLPLVVLMAIAAAACASANAPEWQVFGPESVGVRELAVDADGKTAYAASDFVYRSVDVGVRWDRTSAPPADVTRVGGALVAADPRLPGTL